MSFIINDSFKCTGNKQRISEKVYFAKKKIVRYNK